MRALRPRGGIRVQVLGSRDREAALRFLSRDARQNLSLLEMVSCLGQAPSPGEVAPRLVGVIDHGEVVAVAATRPSLVLDAAMGERELEACAGHLVAVSSGLIKSPVEGVNWLWTRLRARGRHALIDRKETGYALEATRRDRPSRPVPPGVELRRADEGDLEDLVFAARASLREEDRPDPFEGDPLGFRRWVRGRISRARLVEVGGEVVFVGYADVRRPEGWLIQGVYTWPGHRRSGYAAAGMAGLVDEAFAAGADHVQLAVIDDNRPAIRLYEGLGFEPFSRLRTILFV